MKVFSTDRFAFPQAPTSRFPVAKYRLLRERLEGCSQLDIREPAAVSDHDLLLAHTPDYVRKATLGELDLDAKKRVKFLSHPTAVRPCGAAGVEVRPPPRGERVGCKSAFDGLHRPGARAQRRRAVRVDPDATWGMTEIRSRFGRRSIPLTASLVSHIQLTRYAPSSLLVRGAPRRPKARRIFRHTPPPSPPSAEVRAGRVRSTSFITPPRPPTSASSSTSSRAFCWPCARACWHSAIGITHALIPNCGVATTPAAATRVFVRERDCSFTTQ